MKMDDYMKIFDEAVRKAVSDKNIIWDRGEMTAYHANRKSSSLPCKNAFEGEIFRGDLSGCHLIVDRTEFKGQVAFNASIIIFGAVHIVSESSGQTYSVEPDPVQPGRAKPTKKWQIILSGYVGEIMWNQANK